MIRCACTKVHDMRAWADYSSLLMQKKFSNHNGYSHDTACHPQIVVVCCNFPLEDTFVLNIRDPSRDMQSKGPMRPPAHNHQAPIRATSAPNRQPIGLAKRLNEKIILSRIMLTTSGKSPEQITPDLKITIYYSMRCQGS